MATWRTTDLFNVLQQTPGGSARGASVHLGYCAAWAFEKTGRKALAIQTLHDLIWGALNEDDPYQLLNGIEGAPALAFYDQLHRLDRFATRPLIWKADLLSHLRRNAEAEETAREAIHLDPTDGNARPGHRLMAYEVLGRILRAEGKSQESARYEAIVRAVRISEQGDLFQQAGLLPQAQRAFESAGAVFAGAYCIEARLARTLDAEGRTDEAAGHWEKAFELMPDSFGEIETICFGCEGIFSEVHHREMALEVFQKLARSEPKNPRVRFMIGQVQEGNRDQEAALQSYRQAIELDPDYLDAWMKILDLADQTQVPTSLLHRAATSVIRLDPLSLHGGFKAVKYMDSYAELWRLYSAAVASLPRPPSSKLYPLTLDTQTRMGMESQILSAWPVDSPLFKGPGAELADSETFSTILNLMPGN